MPEGPLTSDQPACPRCRVFGECLANELEHATKRRDGARKGRFGSSPSLEGFAEALQKAQKWWKESA